jgi:hypothetical protein
VTACASRFEKILPALARTRESIDAQSRSGWTPAAERAADDPRCSVR